MNGRINIRIPDAVERALKRAKAKRVDGADMAQVVRELLVEALKARGDL